MSRNSAPERREGARHLATGRILLALAAIGVISTIAWTSVRYLEYRDESNLRAGIGDLKEGKYAEALAKIAPYARKGNRLAQESLSLMHARGLGVPVDSIRARIWLRRAECGCNSPGKAELDLGHSFLVGIPLPKDPSRALYWYQQAAEAGHATAQRLLADPQEASRRGLAVPTQVAEYWRDFLKRPE